MAGQRILCWSCMSGGCYKPPLVHTWMDEDDADTANLTWPLTTEQQAERACSCSCAAAGGT